MRRTLVVCPVPFRVIPKEEILRTWDVLLGGIFAIAGVFIFLQARTFPNLAGGYPGPGFFPQLLAVLLVLSGLGIAANAAVKRVRPRTLPLSDVPRREKITALLVVLAVVLYVVAADTLGFIPVVSILVIGLMLRTGVSRRSGIAVGIGVTLAIYVVFERILRVPLPSGMFGQWPMIP